MGSRSGWVRSLSDPKPKIRTSVGRRDPTGLSIDQTGSWVTTQEFSLCWQCGAKSHRRKPGQHNDIWICDDGHEAVTWEMPTRGVEPPSSGRGSWPVAST
jgi:hypothetical protein